MNRQCGHPTTSVHKGAASARVSLRKAWLGGVRAATVHLPERQLFTCQLSVVARRTTTALSTDAAWAERLGCPSGGGWVNKEQHSEEAAASTGPTGSVRVQVTAIPRTRTIQ
jgi:hypothetical protein